MTCPRLTVEDGRQLFISNGGLSKVTENRANVLRGRSEATTLGDRAADSATIQERIAALLGWWATRP